jgi:hypothetical protein
LSTSAECDKFTVHFGKHALGYSLFPWEEGIAAAVRVAFFCGIGLVIVMQTLGIIVFSVVWWRRMGGTGEQS